VEKSAPTFVAPDTFDGQALSLVTDSLADSANLRAEQLTDSRDSAGADREPDLPLLGSDPTRG